MNNTMKIALIVVAVLVVAGGLFFAGQVYGNWQNGSQYGFWGMPMMQRYGVQNSQAVYGRGPSMMGGRSYGGMTLAPGASAGVNGGYNNAANVQPLTVDEARQSAQKYINSLGLSDLSLGEVMVFDNNAYVVVKETSTGMGAFELLVDPTTKIAYPEHGPNMMWNQKYGGVNHNGMMGGSNNMMGGRGPMMGGGYGQNFTNATPSNVTADMPVTQDQAIKNAQVYLDQYQPGTVAATDPVKFYGYYTLDFSKDGKVVGMLSVNGYNGEVFLHTWHGTFIEEAR